MKLSVRVKTFQSAGRFQHTAYEMNAKRTDEEVREISENVVNMLKKINEVLYEEMPDGSSNLVSTIEYKYHKN